MQTDRDHPNTMEMKSTASYPSPPPYSATTPYPGPQPYYGYPYPATSATPNHPLAPPTTDIGFSEVHTVAPNHEPSSMVVVYRQEHPYMKIRCFIASIFSLLSIVATVIILVKILTAR